MTTEGIRIAALIGATIPAVLFVVLYARLEPWSATRFGRHIMGYTAVVAALLFTAVLFNLGVSMPYRDHLLTVLYVLLAVVLWDRVVLIITTHRDARRARRRQEQEALR